MYLKELTMGVLIASTALMGLSGVLITAESSLAGTVKKVNYY